MRIGELLRQGAKELESEGVADASLDICLLLGHCLSMSRTQLYLAMEENVPEADITCFFNLLARRKQREPVAYILGEREFWSLPFWVTKDVLIPRPETEFLLETALKTVKSSGLPDGFLLDLCSGSGVIAIVLALELQKKVIAVDLSQKALDVARNNAKRHGVEKLVDFVRADLLASFAQDNRFSLIVSNPPYVTRKEMRCDLEPEVIGYEPHLALDGGENGLEVITKIQQDLPHVLCHGGWFFMEMGASQGQNVQAFFSTRDDKKTAFEQIQVRSDYAGRDRVFSARFTIR